MAFQNFLLRLGILTHPPGSKENFVREGESDEFVDGPHSGVAASLASEDERETFSRQVRTFAGFRLGKFLRESQGIELADYSAKGESAALACVEVFCRMTPVWSTKYEVVPVVPRLIGSALIV